MKSLGQAELVDRLHETGALVRYWDLTPFGGPMVFMGPVTQQLPVGTIDRGNLRLDTYTGAVWVLEAGDPKPTIGSPGAALSLLPFIAVVGVAWFLGRARRR